ncbi:PIH1 domain-containing protein 1 isoform X2 [Drosophila grimshawi]|uniref:PIH1 domain-containing protein 1 isoform X2 n=1 Tax=Drosophila grimshawi TaxID=7222 RepID=UPI000C870904|nr:PIH1 domain-containing protein 1 isoform X2 [Drosophila grimshawi]
MSRRTNFIDGNDSFREQNLRFVRNEFEDNINQFFGSGNDAGPANGPGQSDSGAPPRDSIIAQPTPGYCVKSFKLNSNEKFFINVCVAPEVPAPKDVTDEELIAILESTKPGSFRVPMSISEMRTTKDRSDNSVEVCDIAINPKFLAKTKKSQLFNNFFLQIVAEALSEKHNIQISMENTIILTNRKFIGTLVAHRVRNDDVKQAEKFDIAIDSSDFPQVQLKQDKQSSSKPASLVQEIDEEHAAKIRNSWAKSREPIYKLRARVRDEIVDEIRAELYLPNCVSSQEFSLDIGEDRILIESQKHGYFFDKFVSYRLNQERAQALFDKTSKMLQVRIPVLSN